MTQDIGDNTFHNADNCDCVRCNPELRKTDFERYAAGAEAIQKSCACIRWSARECYTARHYRPSDDLDEPTWEDDDDCECSCHDELHQLEEDVYGPRDD